MSTFMRNYPPRQTLAAAAAAEDLVAGEARASTTTASIFPVAVQSAIETTAPRRKVSPVLIEHIRGGTMHPTMKSSNPVSRFRWTRMGMCLRQPECLHTSSTLIPTINSLPKLEELSTSTTGHTPTSTATARGILAQLRGVLCHRRRCTSASCREHRCGHRDHFKSPLNFHRTRCSFPPSLRRECYILPPESKWGESRLTPSSPQIGRPRFPHH